MDHDCDGPLRDTHRHGGAYIGNEGHRPDDKAFSHSGGNAFGNAGWGLALSLLWRTAGGQLLILGCVAYGIYAMITAEPYENKEWREIECADDPNKTCKQRVLPN